MGLPEHYATLQARSLSPKLGRAVLQSEAPIGPTGSILLALDSPPPLSHPVESLGHQYLFGMIPLTTVFLQHSANQLLGELAVELLEGQGLAVYTTSGTRLGEVLRVIEPESIVELKVSEARVNAFDAFFVRILKARAQVQATVLERKGNGTVPKRQLEQRGEKSEYRRYGHAPQLSHLLQSTLKSALERLVPGLQAKSERRFGESDSTPPTGTGLVLLAPPEFERPPTVRAGEVLALSYGFESSPPYTNGQMARMIQHGLARGLEAENVLVVSSSVPTLPKLKLARAGEMKPALWRLRALVQELTFPDTEDETLRLTLKLHLDEIASGSKPQPLLSARCTVEEPRMSGVDGAWVATLEEAGTRMVSDFLRGRFVERLGDDRATRSVCTMLPGDGTQ